MRALTLRWPSADVWCRATLALAFLAACTDATPPEAPLEPFVEGTLRTSTGDPVSGATLQVYAVDSSRVRDTVVSADSEGRFSVSLPVQYQGNSYGMPVVFVGRPGSTVGLADSVLADAVVRIGRRTGAVVPDTVQLDLRLPSQPPPPDPGSAAPVQTLAGEYRFDGERPGGPTLTIPIVVRNITVDTVYAEFCGMSFPMFHIEKWSNGRWRGAYAAFCPATRLRPPAVLAPGATWSDTVTTTIQPIHFFFHARPVPGEYRVVVELRSDSSFFAFSSTIPVERRASNVFRIPPDSLLAKSPWTDRIR